MGALLESFLEEPRKPAGIGAPLSDCTAAGRRMFVVQSASRLLPTNIWNNELSSFICPLRSLYTFPLWDWWIEPLFPRRIFGSRDFHLIITEPLDSVAAQKFRSILSRLNINCLSQENLDSPLGEAGKRLAQFRRVLLELMPQKLAFELGRIERLITENEFERCVFILRGAYFISEFLKTPERNSNFQLLDLHCRKSAPRVPANNRRTLYIDDALGMGRSLDLLLKGRGENQLNFAALDAAFPLECYREVYPSVSFYLPRTKLNIYGSRLFEDNPQLSGIDFNPSRRIKRHDNVVRGKFIDRIRSLMQLQTAPAFSSSSSIKERRQWLLLSGRAQAGRR